MPIHEKFPSVNVYPGSFSIWNGQFPLFLPANSPSIYFIFLPIELIFLLLFSLPVVDQSINDSSPFSFFASNRSFSLQFHSSILTFHLSFIIKWSILSVSLLLFLNTFHSFHWMSHFGIPLTVYVNVASLSCTLFISRTVSLFSDSFS